MPDSGIERAINLPRLLSAVELSDPKLLFSYLQDLHYAIATMYDDFARRINEFLSLVEYGHSNPDTITAAQNDYVLPDGVVHRLASDASRAISGFMAPFMGRFVVCLNIGAFDVTFLHQSGLSFAENRIITVSGGTITLTPGQSTAFWYDIGTDLVPVNRWRQLSL